MKKIFLIFSFLIGFSLIFADGDIQDYDSYVKITYTDGTIDHVKKAKIVNVKADGDYVYLVTDQELINYRVTGGVRLKPSDFGYSTTSALATFLAGICHNAYDSITYAYEADYGNVDTIVHYVGSSATWTWVGAYDGDSLTTQSKVVH